MGKGFGVISNMVMLLSTIIILAAAVTVIWTIGPWIETKYFPVVEKLRIVGLHPGVEPGTSEFVAEFNKVRPCEYIGIGWYVDGTNERVNMQLFRTDKSDTAVNRPPGFTHTGPWIVSLPPNQIRPPFGWWTVVRGERFSHALLFHRCNALWISTTEFYP